MNKITRHILIAIITLSQFSQYAYSKGSLNNTAPVYFISNAGQITDQYNTPRADIDYKLEANGVTLFVGDGQLHYQWTRSQKEELKNNKEESNTATDIVDNISIYRMDVTLVGANKHAKVLSSEAATYYEQYYTIGGSDGVRANSYKRITYQNIYPNIDWTLYIQNGQLKYDFIVHQGGNVADIQLRYDGTTGINLKDGALIATTPYGSITEATPYTYTAQSKTPINSNYILNDNTVSYNIATDVQEDIVIDPALRFSTYYGGYHAEGATAVIPGHNDDVYLAGHTFSTNNIASTGAHQVYYSHNFTGGSGFYDGFLAKFNSYGVRQWATYYPASFSTGALDAQGDLYLVGMAVDTVLGVTTAGTHKPIHNNTNGNKMPAQDAVLIKFNSSGQRVWGTYYGGDSTDYSEAIAIDGNGYIYIGGYTCSDTGVATGGAYMTQRPVPLVAVSRGGAAAYHNSSFIARFTPSGQRVWGTYIPGLLAGITTDSKGNLYICGSTYDTAGIASAGAYQTSHNSSFVGTDTTGDGFIMKFDSTGSRQWGTYYGGSNTDYLTAITCDAKDNIYLCGGTNSANGIATTGTHKTTTNTNYSDALLTKFNSNGQRIWGTYYGGSSWEYAFSICYTANNELIINGRTLGNSGIATNNAYQQSQSGSTHFLASFDTSGQQQYGTYWGTAPTTVQRPHHFFILGYIGTASGIDFGENIGGSNSVAYSNNGMLYFCGTATQNSIPTLLAHQNSFGGSIDAFLAAFVWDTVAYIQQPFTDTFLCLGDTLRIPYGVTENYNSNNVFSIQLSDANGSFSSPTTIGSRTDNNADTIVCVIPVNTTPGSGYRIRITASSPSFISGINNGKDIRIGGFPQGFSVSSNTPACTADTLHLTGSSTDTGVTWAWTGVGSFSSSAEDTFILNPTVAMSGDYILTATLNSSGCSLRDTVTVQVKPTPYKPTTSSNAPLCAGGSLNLTSTSTSTGISYSWAGPGGYTSSSQNPTINNISAAASGDYISTVTMNGCTNKDTISVVINPIPNMPTAGSNSPLCAGQVLNLTASTVSNATYTWWGPAAYSATVQNPTRGNITTSHAGMYYVFATVNGCNSDTDSVAVQVNPDPQVNVVATPGSNICAGQSATFVAFTSNAGATPTFKWMLNGVATGNTTTSYINSSLQTGDVVYCIMDATGNCSGSYTDTSNITTMLVSPVVAPTVTINANPALPVAPWTLVTFTATPINGGVNPTYQWKRNGQDVVGATNDTWGTYQLSDGDVVSVILYSTYQCADPDSAVSNAINIQLNLGVDDLTAGSLQLYPNPNNGSFTLKGNVANNKPVDLTIINKLGQLVYQTTIQPQNNTINQHININKELTTGIYLLQLKTENAHSNVKLQIQ